MASLSDQQLIQYIQEGRREALGQLFDRYGADLYDFLARLVGDRDQAARLLEEVFMRVPGAVAGLPARESVRGWLYSLAREAGLTVLRQKGWLDSLPPTEEPGPAGLSGDVWKAARAMPAFYRAVLTVEELHSLSPTEKARALGVQRTDLPRLVDEARKFFTRIFDAQARGEGRPTSSQIDSERIIGLRPRVSSPDATLFSFLPVLVMPDSLQQVLRQRIVQAMSGQPLRPIEPVPTPVEPVPPAVQSVPEPEQSMTTVVTTESGPPVVPPPPRRGFGGLLPLGALAALAGVALALLICGLVYFFFIARDSNRPIVDSLDPPDGSTVSQSDQISVAVNFHDDKGVDPARCCSLMIDGNDVTALTTTTDRGMAWSGPLALGAHTAVASITDRAGNKTTTTWHFIEGPSTGTPGVTLTFTGTVTIPLASLFPTSTPLATLTPLPTLTPIFIPTSIPPTVPPVIPTATPVPPTPTPCVVGIFGKVFYDINGNQVQDSGEPTLSGVILTLQNSSGAPMATTTSDTFGTYQFSGLAFGTYRVVASTPPGWYPTTPTIVTVNMFGCGSYVGLDFGFNQATPTPPPTAPPTNTPTQTFTLTSVPPTNTPTFTKTATPGALTVTYSVSATPTTANSCPATINFSAPITVNQAVTIAYNWVGSNGYSKAGSITFGGPFPQTQIVTDSRTINGPSPFDYHGWQRLDILVPTPTTTPTPTSTPNTTLTPQPSPTPTGANIVYYSVHCP